MHFFWFDLVLLWFCLRCLFLLVLVGSLWCCWYVVFWFAWVVMQCFGVAVGLIVWWCGGFGYVVTYDDVF